MNNKELTFQKQRNAGSLFSFCYEAGITKQFLGEQAAGIWQACRSEGPVDLHSACLGHVPEGRIDGR